jgi:hypothetical protein
MTRLSKSIKNISFRRLNFVLIFWYLVDIIGSSLIPVLKASSLILYAGITVKKSTVQFLVLAVLISLLTSDWRNLEYLLRVNFFIFVIVVLNNRFRTYSLELVKSGVVLMTYLSFAVLLVGFLVSDPVYGDTGGLAGGSRGLVESGNQIFWMNFFIYLSNRSLDEVYERRFSLTSLISVISFILIQTKLSLLLFVLGILGFIGWRIIWLIPILYLFINRELFLDGIRELNVLELLIYKLENENVLSAITNNRYDKWMDFEMHIFPSNTYFNFESTILNLLSNAGILVSFCLGCTIYNVLRYSRSPLHIIGAIFIFSSLGGHLEEAVISVFAIVSYLYIQRYRSYV